MTSRWTPTYEMLVGALGHGQIEEDDFVDWLVEHDREIHNTAINYAVAAINGLRDQERNGNGGPYDLRDARDFVKELLHDGNDY